MGGESTEVNRPEVIAELTAQFERYEDALGANDLEVLAELFWHSPHLGPGVAARFAAGSRITPADLDAARAFRPRITERVRSVLQGGKVLVIPSACGPAPTPEGARTDRDDIRERTLRLTCIAGNAGAPVVSVPAATVNCLPVGLSLIGAPGTDESVLRLASTRWGPRSARTSVSATP